MSNVDPSIITRATVTFTVHVTIAGCWDPKEPMLRPLREAKETASQAVRNMVRDLPTSANNIRFGQIQSVQVSVVEDPSS